MDESSDSVEYLLSVYSFKMLFDFIASTGFPKSIKLKATHNAKLMTNADNPIFPYCFISFTAASNSKQASRHNATKCKVAFASEVSTVFSAKTVIPKIVSFILKLIRINAVAAKIVIAKGRVASTPAERLNKRADTKAKITTATVLSAFKY